MDKKRSDQLRIIWAIAFKDIVDAIKNKTTLSVILSVLFLIVIYQILPEFENGNPSPTLILYDKGASRFVSQLEGAHNLALVPASSQDWMERYIGHRDFVVLGLVLPPNFDELTGIGDLIQLEGYAIHWAHDEDAIALQSFFEGVLEELTGNQVVIHIDGNSLFTRSDSRGMAFLVSAMVVLSLLMIGVSLIPNLMLEEKISRTIESLLVSPASEGLLVAGKALSGHSFA
jgi:ABC-type Na+ efflux pump permease subunit